MCGRVRVRNEKGRAHTLPLISAATTVVIFFMSTLFFFLGLHLLLFLLPAAGARRWLLQLQASKMKPAVSPFFIYLFIYFQPEAGFV